MLSSDSTSPRGAEAGVGKNGCRADGVQATQAARAADAAQLDVMRAYFQTEQRNQALPVITHIDQLRPLQHWQPPCNIQQRVARLAQDSATSSLLYGDEQKYLRCQFNLARVR
jgi:hypothetical protein